MRRIWTLFLVLFAAGCSGLHTGASPDFDWSRVEKISVQGPWEKYQELQKPTLQEVAAMGYDVVPPSSPEADARLELDVVEALDINEVGAVFSRPKSLHVRIYEADSGAPVALADYELASSQSAVDGVLELFAGVKKERRSSTAQKATPAASTETTRQEKVSPSQAESSVKAEDSASRPSDEQPSQAVTEKAQQAEEQMPQEAPAPPREPAQERAQTAETQAKESEAADEWESLEKKKRSPWAPRLESWGFEDWGKPREGDGLEEMMK